MRRVLPLWLLGAVATLVGGCNSDDEVDTLRDSELSSDSLDPDDVSPPGETDSDPVTDSDPRNDTDPLGPNHRPVADAQLLDLDEDSALPVTLTARDADGDTLSFAVLTQPLHGALTGTSPDLQYVPNPNFHGVDRFTFAADDGVLSSATAEVVLRVAPVNDLPVGADSSVQVEVGGQLAVGLLATDIDGDPLSYEVITQPSVGTLSGAAPSLVYQAPELAGSTSFTWRASDPAGSSAVYTVQIGLVPVGDAPPVAHPQNVLTDEDEALVVLLTGEDAEGASLSYQVTRAPAFGVLSGTGASLTYTPDADWSGSDSFLFVVHDGYQDSAPAEVNVAVWPVNDAPVALGGSWLTDEDQPVQIAPSGDDVDGDPLSFELTVDPGWGTIEAASGWFTPAPNVHGEAPVLVRAWDGALWSAWAELTVLIEPVNDPPVGAPLQVSTLRDRPVRVVLAADDVDGDALSYGTGQLVMGTLTGTPPAVDFLPAAGFVGAASFEYTVSDGALTAGPYLVQVEVDDFNGPPTFAPLSVSTPEDTPLPLVFGAQDPDGDALSYAVHRVASHGAVSFATGGWRYQPSPDYFGDDSFEVTVSDGVETVGPVLVTVQVTPVNDPPVVWGASYEATEDTPFPFVLVVTDVDDAIDALTWGFQLPPDAGSIDDETAPYVTYLPEPDRFGVFPVQVIANDGEASSLPAEITLNVAPVNDAPVLFAPPAPIELEEDLQGWGFQPTFSDVDNQLSALTLVLLSTLEPDVGVAVVDGHRVEFTPASNFNGPVELVLKVYDGQLGSAHVPFPLQVNPRNDPPSALPGSYSLDEDGWADVRWLASDPDVGDTLSFELFREPLHGEVSGTPPEVRYTPDPNYHGADNFEFRVVDGAGAQGTARVDLTVRPVDDPPELIVSTLDVQEDQRTPIGGNGFVPAVVVTDVDGPAPTVAVVSGPAHGALDGAWPALFYVPAANYHGDDVISLQAHAGPLSSAVVELPIRVLPVNDPPVAGPDVVLALYPGQTVSFELDVTDVDGDTLTFAFDVEPLYGEVIASSLPGQYAYASENGWTGMTRLRWHATDPSGLSTRIADVAFNVLAPPPGPVNDLYQSVGNFELEISAAEGVLANDPVTGSAATVSTSTYVTTLGGSVLLEPDGAFRYYPPIGAPVAPNRVTTDTFVYTLLDEDSGVEQQATVSIRLNGRVWYVGPPPASAGGAGTSWSPFATLGAAWAAATAGDIVAVSPYEVADYVGGHDVPAGVLVWGAVEPLVVANRVVQPAVGRPQVTFSGAYGFRLANDAELHGFEIFGATGAGVTARGASGLRVEDVLISVGAGVGVDLASCSQVDLVELSVTSSLLNGVQLDDCDQVLVDGSNLRELGGRGVYGVDVTGLRVRDSLFDRIGTAVLGTPLVPAAGVWIEQAAGLVEVLDSEFIDMSGALVWLDNTSTPQSVQVVVEGNQFGSLSGVTVGDGVHVDLHAAHAVPVSVRVERNVLVGPLERGVSVGLTGAAATGAAQRQVWVTSNDLSGVLSVGVDASTGGAMTALFGIEQNTIVGGNRIVLPGLGSAAALALHAEGTGRLGCAMDGNHTDAFDTSLAIGAAEQATVVAVDAEGEHQADVRGVEAAVESGAWLALTLEDSTYAAPDPIVLTAPPNAGSTPRVGVALRRNGLGGGVQFSCATLLTATCRFALERDTLGTPFGVPPTASELYALLTLLDNRFGGGSNVTFDPLLANVAVTLVAPGTVALP